MKGRNVAILVAVLLVGFLIPGCSNKPETVTSETAIIELRILCLVKTVTGFGR